MAKHPHSLPFTRREFLKVAGSGLGLLSFSTFAPAFVTRSALAQIPKAERDRTILVLLQLAGGNDGLNTVVPFTNDLYHNLRPNLGLKGVDLLPINEDLALHPACSGMYRLLNEGKLTIVQNVGYPNPNRSHFRSSEIWETATDSDQFSSTGWIGRLLDSQCPDTVSSDPRAIGSADEVPQSFLSLQPQNVFVMPNQRRRGRDDEAARELLYNLTSAPVLGDSVEFLKHTIMDTLVTEERIQQILAADKPEANYPATPLAASLRNIAGLIAAGLETRVYFASQGGYDTHVNQIGNHQRLLLQLSDSLLAFQTDLEQRGLDRQVLLVTFSEFGRRPHENDAIGTDHGTAAPLFIMGANTPGGLVGSPPNLNLRPGADLDYQIDFRQVYATVLEDFLGHPSDTILGRQFNKLNICTTNA